MLERRTDALFSNFDVHFHTQPYLKGRQSRYRIDNAIERALSQTAITRGVDDDPARVTGI